jgi:hypothetical protein
MSKISMEDPTVVCINLDEMLEGEHFGLNAESELKSGGQDCLEPDCKQYK